LRGQFPLDHSDEVKIADRGLEVARRERPNGIEADDTDEWTDSVREDLDDGRTIQALVHDDMVP